MTDYPLFHFKEHNTQEDSDPIRLDSSIEKGSMNSDLKADSPLYLGLHKDDKGEFRIGYYVGIRWIEWNSEGKQYKGILYASPKRTDIHYEQLLMTCLLDEKVRPHLTDCFSLFPDEPPIPIPNNSQDFITPFAVCDFLVKVDHIAKKGLKKNFVRETSILAYTVKGKINIAKSMKHSAYACSPRNSCSYQRHTGNCIENRILKSALIKILSYAQALARLNPKIGELLQNVLRAFENVESIDTNTLDFSSILGNPFYKEYQPALTLARILLKQFSYSVEKQMGKVSKYTIPFFINMPELFERYCEVLLRRKYDNILVGYGRGAESETSSGHRQLRPDFLLPKENRIVDSKYKFWADGGGILDESDISQLCLYSRHDGILKKLNNTDKVPIMQFIYPELENGARDVDFSQPINKKVDEIVKCYKYPLDIKI